jgi:hypothetical protein
MRHALAAIEAAIFFCGPCLLIVPRLEIGPGTLGEEDAPHAPRAHRRTLPQFSAKSRNAQGAWRQRDAPLSINAWLIAIDNMFARCT